jgi:hypothetical protein
VPGVVVICGLKREASILAGADCITICGGASSLKRRLAELAGSKPQLVISWGICAGLVPAWASPAVSGARPQSAIRSDGRAATIRSLNPNASAAPTGSTRSPPSGSEHHET